MVDQITKALVRGSLSFEQTRHLLPGVTLVREQNSGVAFSLLTGSEAGVIAITLVVVSAVLRVLRAPALRAPLDLGSPAA